MTSGAFLTLRLRFFSTPGVQGKNIRCIERKKNTRCSATQKITIFKILFFFIQIRIRGKVWATLSDDLHFATLDSCVTIHQ